MTDIDEPVRRWESEPLVEPVPGPPGREPAPEQAPEPVAPERVGEPVPA